VCPVEDPHDGRDGRVRPEMTGRPRHPLTRAYWPRLTGSVVGLHGSTRLPSTKDDIRRSLLVVRTIRPPKFDLRHYNKKVKKVVRGCGMRVSDIPFLGLTAVASSLSRHFTIDQSSEYLVHLY